MKSELTIGIVFAMVTAGGNQRGLATATGPEPAIFCVTSRHSQIDGYNIYATGCFVDSGL